ncbi:uncharacterized protein [Spinacia oleracea]|uniref:Uncharacterized protein n=7 Tax=Spinacia oleracea TaxID=3562 RepID=A0ABM3RBT4_SPIOL|nr:uncharacterized protein LOC130467942 [Spinacia oleracea]XP_056693072.1 uncharacterized protein LOC130467942 [Spinacia oleracea]XP_056693073.1 uncharacterized protein LOC130467942 [Spinacia oleracea]
MSYRTKRTLVAIDEGSSIAASKSPKSSDPSTQNWGPFSPPTLEVSQTFGTVSQPIKQPVAAKKTMVAPQSSLPRPTSMVSKPQLKALSKPSFTQTKPSSNPLQQPIPPTLTGTTQSRWYKGPTFPNLTEIATQKASTPNPHQPTMQPVLQPFKATLQPSLQPFKASQQPQTATNQPQKTTHQLHKATQQPQKATQQPVSSFTSVKPHLEKRAFVAPLGATKHVMSQSPTPPDTMAMKKRTGKQEGQLPPTYMHVSENAFQPLRSPPSNQVESEVMPNYNWDEFEESASESENEFDQGEGSDTAVKKATLRHRIIIPNWPESREFDEKVEAIAIDADGIRHLVKGPVLPRDVWHDAKGFRYIVKLNEFNQPIRKGGKILVSFLGDIAKNDSLCPVGVPSWRAVNNQLKTNVVTMIRKHFVLPDGPLVNKALVMRIDKPWNNHRYKLKRDFFDPVNKSREENYANVPDGVSTRSWTELVDYWLLPEAMEKSEMGKNARALQGNKHNSGATSFANRRVDMKEKKGVFSELAFFKSVYAKEDGSFKEGTLPHQFVEDANKKVQENLASSSSSKPVIEIENAVFNELMYKGEVPKRPLNYGFGVKQSDIFGVEGLLRKEGSSYVNNNAMEVENMKGEISVVKKQNEDLAQQNQVLNTKFEETTQSFKMIASFLGQVLKEVRKGNVSSNLLDGAESAINMITDDSGGNGDNQAEK